MDRAKRYRPFANGSQYADWEASNCVRCTQYAEEDPTCPIMYALALACLDDGTVDEDIARRMGYLNDDGTDNALRYGWPCREVEWTEAWKAEWRAAHGDDDGR